MPLKTEATLRRSHGNDPIPSFAIAVRVWCGGVQRSEARWRFVRGLRVMFAQSRVCGFPVTWLACSRVVSVFASFLLALPALLYSIHRSLRTMSDPMTQPVGPAQETPKAPEAAGRGIRMCSAGFFPSRSCSQNVSAADSSHTVITHDPADHASLVAESLAVAGPLGRWGGNQSHGCG